MISRNTFILLRHSKAIKNEQDRHGGNGSELVKGSDIDIGTIAKIFSEMPFKFDRILYSPRKQCELTANLLSDFLELKSEMANDIIPINLGIIDGLSNDEVRNLYPEIASKLRKWRERDIEINKLQIPEMESSSHFLGRGKAFINGLFNNNSSTIIVATRSICVLLTSILLNRTVEIGGNYREIKWNNDEFLVFSYGELGVSIHTDISSVKL